MDEMILQEVRRDVFEHPKSTIDLDYLISIKRQVQELADDTNDQLKKNVYQNYSLFIESSREISTLKDEMRQLNNLLEQQQNSMNKLLDQLNKSPIVKSSTDRPKVDPFRLDIGEDTTEMEAEMFPSWLVKAPEDFDVLIAQRNLREAVDLTRRVRGHFEEYPKCCDNQERASIKSKLDARIQELISAISSELQPTTDRTIQGGPRSSISAIKLLRELNLSSRAVKLYLDQRSSVLKFVLSQHKAESITTLQFLRQLCSIFFHNIVETCNEYKQAFSLNDCVNKAIEESVERLNIVVNQQGTDQTLLFDLVKPIYTSTHLPLDSSSPTNSGGNDISAHILSGHQVHDDRLAVENNSLINPSRMRNRAVFNNLSFYASLTYWIISEFDNFLLLFKHHVFNTTPQLSVSIIAESIYHLRAQCTKVTMYCEIDMSTFVERKLEHEIRQLVGESEKKLIEMTHKLNKDEKWQAQQFQNKAQLTRFLEEMNDVELKTMKSYIFEELKLRFTACKTSFARYYLITVTDLAKLVSSINKDYIDTVLTRTFELEMQHVIEALGAASKQRSQVRFIMGNSNFLLDKVIVVADEQYKRITGFSCRKLCELRAKYAPKVKSVANM